jgi:hypothetical protein
MNREFALFAVAALALATSGCLSGNGPVACTADARLCPDGTAVGRVPPDCDFAPCPACSPGDEIYGQCPDGSEYLKLSCDDKGEWHEVQYIRNPCEAL